MQLKVLFGSVIIYKEIIKKSKQHGNKKEEIRGNFFYSNQRECKIYKAFALHCFITMYIFFIYILYFFIIYSFKPMLS